MYSLVLLLVSSFRLLVCNRAAFNDPERIDDIVRRIKRSVQSGAARQLRDQKTSYCPDESFESPSDDPSNPDGTLLGPPSGWIVTNSASTPAVISWVRNVKGQGNVEVSAFNPDGVTPAHHDPRAILQPGDWRSLSVLLGHTFHVREMVDVGGGQLAPGRILLRHRAGPIPIRNRWGGPYLSCPVQAIVDPEPEPDEGFDRNPFDFNRRCNSLFSMFTNRMHCPVDVYYAGVDPTAVNSNTMMMPKNATAPTNSCAERFSFHLGVNPSARDDLMDAWESPVAYEATYLTHKFVARLHHDPSIVVDEITSDKTYVQDCPSRSETTATTSVGEQEAVLTNSGISDEEKNDDFFITDLGVALASRNNSTSSVKEAAVALHVQASTTPVVSSQNCTAKEWYEWTQIFGDKDEMCPATSSATEVGTASVDATN